MEQKITLYTLKYAKIRILMVSSILCIASQVEHTEDATVLTVKASLWNKMSIIRIL